MVQAGKHKAKISDWGVKETKAGKPYIEVWFNVQGQGDVPWAGHLTEKTIERTLKTLAHCGLKGALETLADGPIGKALDTSIELDIDVELVAGTKDPAKKFPKVKWVNPVRGAKFDAAISKQAKGKLSEFSGTWTKVKNDLGIKKSTDVGF